MWQSIRPTVATFPSSIMAWCHWKLRPLSRKLNNRTHIIFLPWRKQRLNSSIIRIANSIRQFSVIESRRRLFSNSTRHPRHHTRSIRQPTIAISSNKSKKTFYATPRRRNESKIQRVGNRNNFTMNVNINDSPRHWALYRSKKSPLNGQRWHKLTAKVNLLTSTWSRNALTSHSIIISSQRPPSRPWLVRHVILNSKCPVRGWDTSKVIRKRTIAAAAVAVAVAIQHYLLFQRSANERPMRWVFVVVRAIVVSVDADR